MIYDAGVSTVLALALAGAPTPTDPGEPPALTGAGALVAGGALQLASIGLHVASFEMNDLADSQASVSEKYDHPCSIGSACPDAVRTNPINNCSSEIRVAPVYFDFSIRRFLTSGG